MAKSNDSTSLYYPCCGKDPPTGGPGNHTVHFSIWLNPRGSRDHTFWNRHNFTG